MEMLAIDEHYASQYFDRIENATAEERHTAHALYADTTLPDIVSYNEAEREATIKINGPMSPDGPSFLALLFGFGGTSYSDIIKATESLANNPNIDTVRLVMNTPGGYVNGLDQTFEALKKLADSKTLIAENHGVIASAGYYLSTTASKIVAMSRFASTGSIGVIVAGIDTTAARERAGIKKFKIVSRNAPDKQADPTTEHGVGVIQREIDAAERVFIKTIANERDVTDQYVIDNYGKGAILIAYDPDPEQPSALSVGMIDEVINVTNNTDGTISAESVTGGGSDLTPDNQEAADGGINENEGTIMDLNTLKTVHPAVYAEAVAVGVTQERDRVEAHVTLGEASGDMNLAMSCIKDGKELTPSIQAKYTAAGMKKNAIASRDDETIDDLETEATDDDETKDDVLAKAVASELGLEMEV